jgi:hypothetical protein
MRPVVSASVATWHLEWLWRLRVFRVTGRGSRVHPGSVNDVRPADTCERTMSVSRRPGRYAGAAGAFQGELLAHS